MFTRDLLCMEELHVVDACRIILLFEQLPTCNAWFCIVPDSEVKIVHDLSKIHNLGDTKDTLSPHLLCCLWEIDLTMLHTSTSQQCATIRIPLLHFNDNVPVITQTRTFVLNRVKS